MGQARLGEMFQSAVVDGSVGLEGILVGVVVSSAIIRLREVLRRASVSELSIEEGNNGLDDRSARL